MQKLPYEICSGTTLLATCAGYITAQSVASHLSADDEAIAVVSTFTQETLHVYVRGEEVFA